MNEENGVKKELSIDPASAGLGFIRLGFGIVMILAGAASVKESKGYFENVIKVTKKEKHRDF